MYSTVPAGSLVTLGGHLRVVLHSDDATASVSADPRRHWRTEKSPRRFHRKRAFAIGQLSEILRNSYNVKIRGLNKVIILPFFVKFYVHLEIQSIIYDVIQHTLLRCEIDK